MTKKRKEFRDRVREVLTTHQQFAEVFGRFQKRKRMITLPKPDANGKPVRMAIPERMLSRRRQAKKFAQGRGIVYAAVSRLGE